MLSHSNSHKEQEWVDFIISLASKNDVYFPEEHLWLVQDAYDVSTALFLEGGRLAHTMEFNFDRESVNTGSGVDGVRWGMW